MLLNRWHLTACSHVVYIKGHLIMGNVVLVVINIIFYLRIWEHLAS